jgi:hypothetical protein
MPAVTLGSCLSTRSEAATTDDWRVPSEPAMRAAVATFLARRRRLGVMRSMLQSLVSPSDP